MKNLLLLFLLLPLFACKQEYKFKDVADGPIKTQYIVVAKTNQGIKARGFKDATPPNTEIDFEIEKTHKKITSNADGSFEFEIPLNDSNLTKGQFSFKVGDKTIQQSFAIRDLESALGAVSKEAFDLPGDINDMAVTKSDALLLSLAGARVDVVKLDESFTLSTKNMKTVSLNPTGSSAPVPRSISAKGSNALVTFGGSHELGLVGIDQTSLLFKSLLKKPSGSLYLFDLDPPLSVKNPISADNTSPPSTKISRSFAHTPQEVMALDDHTFIVSFVNYYQFYDPSAKTNAVVGPGIVALVSIENDQIKTQSILLLPYKNPLFFNQAENNSIWVTCVGVYDTKDGKIISTDAGFVQLQLSNDKKSISQKHQIPLKDFIPAQPALVKGTLIVPESYGQRVALFKEDADQALSNVKELKHHRPLLFRFASHWHDDVVFLGEERSLIAFSLSSEEFFPFPFKGEIILDKKQGSGVAFAPDKMLFRPSEIHAGFSAFVLSQMQYRIIPLDLLEIFGP